MIERALTELNEKWGSSEESILQYLEKRYDNLPWVHSVLLKHHLEKLCESGDIVMTRDKRYGLPGCLNSSTEVKRKPRRRKWRWDWERQRHNQNKKKLSKKRNQQKGEKVEVIKKHREYDEKEQQLSENGVRSEDKRDQTKRLLSCVDGENGVCATNEKKYSEEVSQQLEIGASEIVKADIWASHTQEQQKREQCEYSRTELSSPERPPGFESIGVENLLHLGSTQLELASAEEFIGSSRTWRQLKRWSGRFPEPKAVNVTSLESVTSPEEECQKSENDMETPQNQQKALDSTPITVKQMHNEKQQSELLKADAVEAVQSVMNDTKLMRDEKSGRRGKNKSKKSETIDIHVPKKSERPTEVQNERPFEPHTTIDAPNLSLTSNQAEFALSNEQEPQELLQQPPSQQTEIFQGKQLRRSLRNRAAKTEVAKDANFVGILLPQPCPEEFPETVRRHQGTPSKQRPGNQPLPEPVKAACTDELQNPPKSRKLRRRLKPKPDAADVENLIVVDDCRGQDLKPSGKPDDCTSIREKMEPLRTIEVLRLSNSKQKLQEVPKTRQRGRQRKCRSANPPKDKMKLPDIEEWG